jgi:rhamnose transport system permease protein
MWRSLDRLKSWEGLLVLILVLVTIANIILEPRFLDIQNLINLFQNHIEKIIVALAMAFIIINGEIDLSVASVMAMAGCLMARLYEAGTPIEVAILVALGSGVVAGIVNGFWVAYVGLPSLAVTLAGLIGYRGIARLLLEDRAIGSYPDWFSQLGQRPIVGPFPASLLIFFLLSVIFLIILHYTAFGRYIYIIGNNREAARYSGVKVRRVKLTLFIISSIIAALAGILIAARFGSMRASTAEGFELDIITMVLLGGVSIFGGTGTLVGVLLAILIMLSLRNGMGLGLCDGQHADQCDRCFVNSLGHHTRMGARCAAMVGAPSSGYSSEGSEHGGRSTDNVIP